MLREISLFFVLKRSVEDTFFGSVWGRIRCRRRDIEDEGRGKASGRFCRQDA